MCINWTELTNILNIEGVNVYRATLQAHDIKLYDLDTAVTSVIT